MCYLIAKRSDDHGCFAIRMEHGKHLVEFKRSIHALVGLDSGIELTVISRPNTYGEYKPYTFVETEEEFIEKVMRMKR